jgi:integrase
MTRDPDQADARTRVGERVTIYKRGLKKTFCAEFSLDGEYRRRSLKTRNLRAARRRAAELEVELAAGTFKRQPPKVTIAEGARMYRDSLTAADRAARTLSRYRRPLIRFADFCRALRVLLLSQVTLLLLDRYLRFLQEVPLGEKSIYIELVIVKQLFKWCFSRGLIAQNPIANYKVAKPVTIPKPAPTLAQIRAILRHASARLATHILLLACTGSRSGELQGLRKEDIDLVAGFVHVRRQVHGPTKTRQERKVPVHSCIRPILRSLLATDDHELLLTALPSIRYPAGGRPINTKKLNDRFKAAAARAGIRGFTVHSLRHMFNTVALNAGVPLPMVRSWMGHTTRSMTELYYHASDAASLRFVGTVPFGVLTAAEDAAKETHYATGFDS